jgi:hypothetical protein
MNPSFAACAAMVVAATLLCGCGSLLNPRPPDVGEQSLSERRAASSRLVADPDPAPLSAFPWSAAAMEPPKAPVKPAPMRGASVP